MTDYKDPFLSGSYSSNNTQISGYNKEHPKLEYASFWDRFLALLMDGIILGIPVGGLNIWNMYEVRSFSLYLLLAIIAISYKPIMESTYGATLGKLLLGIKVLNEKGEKITTYAGWFRNIFTISQSSLQIPFYFLAFNNAALIGLEGMEFSSSIATAYPTLNIFSFIYFIIIIIELVMLLSDSIKKQSLHDRIAKTIVVKK